MYGVLWTQLLSCFSYQTVTTCPTVNHQVNVHQASASSVPVTDAVLGRRIPSAPLGPHGHCRGAIHAGTGRSLHSGHLVSSLLCGLPAVKSWMSSRHVIRYGSQGGRVHPIPPPSQLEGDPWGHAADHITWTTSFTSVLSVPVLARCSPLTSSPIHVMRANLDLLLMASPVVKRTKANSRTSSVAKTKRTWYSVRTS